MGIQMTKLVSIFKKVICIVITIYAVITFCKQQTVLNTYASNKEDLNKQIAEASKEQDELTQIKKNANSKEYIEEIAREKLDMYLPNERVYIDRGN